MFGMGPSELMIVGIIAVLLFGRRLPEVAKSLGSSYREFRKGLNELQSQVNVRDIYSTPLSSPKSSYTEPKASTYGNFDDHSEATAPKFEPPPCEPQTTSADTDPKLESSPSEPQMTSAATDPKLESSPSEPQMTSAATPPTEQMTSAATPPTEQITKSIPERNAP
jgi:sec-independent protein translocase protein TatA